MKQGVSALIRSDYRFFILIAILLVSQWVGANIVLAQTRLGLTETERAYLIDKREITMCVDPNWMPYEKINEQGRHVGVAADFMREFASNIGIAIVLTPTKTWKESLEFAQQGKCEILSLLNKSPERDKFLDFTDPYLHSSTVLVARDDVFYLDGLGALSGKKLGIVEGYVYAEKIRNRFPEVQIVNVKSLDESLRLVSKGEIDAGIDTLLLISRHIQELGLTNLKIAGQTDLDNDFRIGVRKGNPILLSILQKAVTHLSEARRNQILQRWYSVSFDYKTDWTMTIILLLIAVFVLFIVVYGYFSQKKLSQQLAELNDQLQEKNFELEHISQTDPLTGCYNRIRTSEQLTDELNRARRYNLTFSLILFDVDYFKKINDTFGHQAGDNALITLARTVKKHIRKNDIFGRWGGEEFIIVCPETDLGGAKALAENLRQKIAATKIADVGKVTASFGVVVYDPAQHPDHKDMISHADLAMYRAKEAGRNKVRTFDD